MSTLNARKHWAPASWFRGKLVVLAIVTSAGQAQATNYVFSTFTGDAIAQEKLSIYESTDALDFKLVSDTGFSGPSGALRDPSIMKFEDGKYYVAYTDPPGAGCCGKEDHFSIAWSADLVHWTNLALVKAGVPGVAHVWAPEWFVEGDTVNIIANIDTLNTDSDFKPYIFTALDASLAAWSGPVAMGIGPNYIDTFALKVGSTYHAFVKNETTRYLEHATASKLTGPWNFIGKADWAGWGSGMEGPTVVQLDDGSWRIFLDPQQAGFVYASSLDLMAWSKTAPLPGLSNVVRHGTVIRDVAVAGGGMSASGGAVGVAGQAGSSDARGGVSLGGSSGAAGSTALAGTAGEGGLVETAAGSSAAGVTSAAGSGVTSVAGSSDDGGFFASGGAPAAAGTGTATPPGQGAPAQNSGCSCGFAPEPSKLSDIWLSGLLGCAVLRWRRRRQRVWRRSAHPDI